MRGARWILLAAILAILVSVGTLYQKQRRIVEANAPVAPQPLPPGIEGQATDWHWSQTDKGRTIVDIRAKSMRQEEGGARIELGGVRLKLFHKDGGVYDLVESARALFSPADRQLFSDGEVIITLGVPTEGQPKRQLVSIKTSGVSFDSTTGKASTDRPAEFIFENGTGRSVGAAYDPQLRELLMRGGIQLDWHKAEARPMKLESETLMYRERDSMVTLAPWARLTRESSVIEAGETFVQLNEGAIERVEARQAKGADQYPQRKLEYSADNLTVNFGATGDVESVRGEQNAKLNSSSPGVVTSMSSDRVDMEFLSQNNESALTKAIGFGNTVVESKPQPLPNRPTPATRILKSEVVELKMRAGGEEIEQMETHSPAKLTFVPNRADDRRRELDGERMSVAYGPKNALDTFRAISVSTTTHPVKSGAPPMRTWSKNMTAKFDPVSGELSRIEQWENFRYAEGTREGTATKAILESAKNVITLEEKARVWDPTGSTSANVIRLNQNNGNYEAEGNVMSSRKQDRKQKSNGMLSGDDPVQATAAKMTTVDGNRLIRYEGNAVLWQGANRVNADVIEIEKAEGRLTAEGNVDTQLVEGQGSKRITTFVKSKHLVYTDQDRVAHYTGGAQMNRPNMQVKSLELRAILAEEGSGSRMERAFADGKVEIVQNAGNRTRTGLSEHAEYEVGEEKVMLRGGNPSLTDSVKGVTRGQELTYFAADDRLVVNGAPERPAASRLRRK